MVRIHPRAPENNNREVNNMEILSNIKALSVICKKSKKFGMYINFYEDQEYSDTMKAAPYLDFLTHYQVFCDCQAWLLFDTEKEMLDYYDKTVGDDGPTKLNQYKGKATVYALTCSPAGELLNENT